MTAPLSAAERAPLIDEYEAGPARLRAGWNRVPVEARRWRPREDAWSAHEIVVHCADSETYAATRIRLLAAEAAPLIVGYDQNAWSRRFDYHAQSAEVALDTIEAVRRGTAPVVRSLDEAAWAKMGTHTESGAFGACDWLRSYAAHLTNHAKQIERNIAAFEAARS